MKHYWLPSGSSCDHSLSAAHPHSRSQLMTPSHTSTFWAPLLCNWLRPATCLCNPHVMVTFSHLMAAQCETFSTTLPLIELQSPIVPNKTNLIDPVYKNLCAAVKRPVSQLSWFIYSLCFPHLGVRSSAWSRRKLGLLGSIWKKKWKDAEE